MRDPEQSPWICHVCDKRGAGDSMICSACYRTTCRDHLKRVSVYNNQSRLYEITWRCVFCTMENPLR